MVKREMKKKVEKVATSVKNRCRFISCSGKLVTVKSHHYAWSGRVPCTGMWKCTRCGKPEDPKSFNGKPGGRKIR
jgi:hypothetical protein